MSLIRLRGESQRAFVKRILREQGSIRTWDALYELAYESGIKCSITRLAAVIHDLRSEGWEIESTDEHGKLAVYQLGREAAPPPVSPLRTPAPLPDWARAWTCQTCGSQPATEPTPLLAGLAEALCPTCRRETVFRHREAVA